MNPQESFFDQIHLKTEAYADSRNLAARANIYRYRVPKASFPEWALSHLPSRLDSVLDVGCGPGTYLAKIAQLRDRSRLVGIDLSEGMLREARHTEAELVVADAQALPFPNGIFDTVLCMHVLYHVPNISLALSEIRRVLERGGRALVATNGDDHQRRLREVFDQTLSELSGEPAPSILASARRFRLEKGGGMLLQHFDSVETFEQRGELVIPEAESIVGYLESVRSFHEPRLPSGLPWEVAVEAFRAKVQAEIDKRSAFRTPVVAGVFLCQ